MADIEVDPAVLRARAAQLAELAEGLAAIAAGVRGTAADAGLLGAGLAARHGELCAGLGRDARELALLADGLRGAADAVTGCDRAVRQRLSAITRSLG